MKNQQDSDLTQGCHFLKFKQNNRYKINMKNKWFTLVELLIWILIFTMGILSSYLLIYSAINASARSRDEIIAWNIWREKLELVRNMRDSNWLQILAWNKLINWWDSDPLHTLTGWYYIIWNDYSWTSAIKITKLSPVFSENQSYIFNPWIWDSTVLCIDALWRYTYDCSWANKTTKIYSYLKVEPLITKDMHWDIPVDNALKVSSINITKWRGNSKYVISTIITDWKK